MKNIFSAFIFSLFVNNTHAVLLDKIAGIVDDNIITLSQVTYAQKNLSIRKNIAPMIFYKESYGQNEMLDIFINKFLIRAKLNELSMPVADDQVEAQIKQNEKRLNVDREQLRAYLKSQKATFDEYFEILREVMEYSYFVNKVIGPSISVSDQEIKNDYIKKYSKESRLNIKYTLIDYSFPKESKTKIEKIEFEKLVKNYRLHPVLPENYSTLQANNLEDITEDGISAELNSLLKKTDEGTLTTSINIDGLPHIFYVSKKDLIESENFSKEKEKIREEIFERNVKTEVALWFEREKYKHYIKISI